MDVALWIAAGFLAVVALAGGAMKVVTPKAKLAAQRGGEWTNGFSAGLIKSIGTLEILAAFGLVLPRLLDIAPLLVSVTALCWMALMVGAALTHRRLGQDKLVLVTVAYFGVAAFVAVGRL
ncbi:MAG: DoxX family protein [Catenulispora sp.]|nr:DoxX family protein [Catenulispora sp.]